MGTFVRKGRVEAAFEKCRWDVIFNNGFATTPGMHYGTQCCAATKYAGAADSAL